MSDFDRNAAAAQYGRPLTRAEAAVVDEGLRAYMLRIYNYMVLGLAITGFAALGVYMLSVTSDPSAAYQAARPLARGMYLTQVGYALFVSPLKWVVILAPLALVFFLSFRIENMRPATAQITFWIYAALVGVSLGVDLPGLHPHLDHARVLHHGGLVRRALAVGLHHAARPHRHGARS